MSLVGIFGGTFDPVHLGHVKMAEEAKSLLALDEVRLLPCHHPPHRGEPQLTSDQRLHLLNLAVAGREGLVVDERELKRNGPSYTVDTLASLREELPPSIHMVLLMGVDAYRQLMSWFQWQEILTLAHIAIFARPGYELPRSGPLADLLAESTQTQFYQKPAGAVIALHQIQMDISATAIRADLAQAEIPDVLHPDVCRYIVEHGLYGYRSNFRGRQEN